MSISADADTARASERPTLTLLDLVRELCATGAGEREVTSTVMDLVRSGRVRLIGQIRGEHLLSN